jgi:hypothetical protein
MSSFTRGAPTETADSTATGPWPRFYKVTIISDGRLRDAAHTDRRITLKARSRLKNGSGRVGEHPAPILAVEKPDARWSPGGRVLGDLFALCLSA